MFNEWAENTLLGPDMRNALDVQEREVDIYPAPPKEMV
jgi:hypothetical protein